MNNKPSDRDLLRAFTEEQCEASFRELVVRYQGVVLHVARRVLGELGDPEAVGQATFLVLAEKAHKLLTSKCLSSWLFSVARNLALKARRSEIRRLTRERKAMEDKTADPSRENAVAVEVCEALAKLPLKYREAILLCHVQGMTQEEAAAQLSVGRGTLSSRIARGLKKLRKVLLKAGIVVSAAAVVGSLEAYSAPAAGLAVGSLATLGKAAISVQQGGFAACKGLMSKTVTELAAKEIQSMLVKAIAAKVGVALSVVSIAAAAYLVIPMPVVNGGNTEPAGVVKKPITPVTKTVPGPKLPKGALARLGTPPMFRDLTRALTISDDGKLLAAGGWQTISVVDIEKQTVVREMKISSIDPAFLDPPRPGYQSDTTNRVQFSRDGKKVFATSDKHGVTEWDIATGKCVRVFGRGRLGYRALALSADGKRLFAGNKGELHTIDTETGKVLGRKNFKQKGWKPSIERIHLLADRETLLLDIRDREEGLFASMGKGPKYKHQFVRFNTRTGKFSREEEGPRMCAVSPDGKLVAVEAGRKTHIADASTGKLLRELKGSASYRNIGFCDNGASVVAYDYKKEILIWETATGALKKRLKTEKDRGILSVPPTGSTFACAFSENLIFYDTKSGRLTPKRNGHAGTVIAAHYEPSESLIISGSWDHTIRVWDVKTSRVLRQIKASPEPNTREVQFLEISPDGGHILTRVKHSPAAILYPLSGKKPAIHLGGSQGRICDAIFSPDGRLVATVDCQHSMNGKAYGGNLTIWDTETGKQLGSMTGVGDNLAFSPDAKRLFATPRGKGVHVIDVETMKIIATIPSRSKDYITKNICVSPNGKLLVEATYHTGGLAVVHADTYKVISEIKMRMLGIQDMRFTKCGNILMIADDGALRLVDVATRKEIRKIEGHRGDIAMAEFSPTRKTILTTSHDHTMLIWDAEWALHAKDAKPIGDDMGDLYHKLHGDDMVETYRALARFAISPKSVAFVAERVAALKEKDWNDVLALNKDPLPRTNAAMQARRIIQLLEMIGTEKAAALLRTIDLDLARAVGKRLASARWQNWQRHRRTVELDRTVVDMAVSPAGTHVATLARDKVTVTAVENLGQDQSRSKTFSLPAAGRQLAYLGKSKLYVIADKTVQEVDLKNSKVRQITKVDSQIRRLAVGGGTRLAIVDAGNTLYLIKSESGDVVKTFRLSRTVRTMCFNRTGDHLALGLTDGTLALVDCRKNTLSAKKAHSFGVTALAFSQEADKLLSASMDLSTALCDIKKGTLSTVSRHESPVAALAAIESSIHLVVHMDGQLLVQAPESKDVMWRTKLECRRVKRLHYSPANDRLFLLCGNGHLHIWGQ